jgi:hypothetical protein
MRAPATILVLRPAGDPLHAVDVLMHGLHRARPSNTAGRGVPNGFARRRDDAGRVGREPADPVLQIATPEITAAAEFFVLFSQRWAGAGVWTAAAATRAVGTSEDREPKGYCPRRSIAGLGGGGARTNHGAERVEYQGVHLQSGRIQAALGAGKAPRRLRGHT